jgi:prephenate dehydratase
MARHTFKIEKMFEIDIKMNLLVRKGATASKINNITSHQQALRQCRMYLKRKWPDAELEEYSDTASAAKDLAEGVLPETTAVIAPKVCAEIYGLDLLEEGIQDLKFNFTNFIVAEK